ncbi:MAG: hypothetical protein RI580_04555 [Halothece sp. Uz-M2-17]|nr:hypothetical protein [Halothece sp. Uz-M2-17]
MHLVRWVLAIGWIGLILSLFFGHLSNIPILEWSHRKGTSNFWGIIVPSAIIILLVLGHEGWRRICPLAFMSQISQKLGIKSRSRIEESSWLGRNHLYMQFGLLFLGLVLRLIWFNDNPIALAILLVATIISAIIIGYLYGGRSWCHYFCPMSPVQTVISGPRGIFTSSAHTAAPLSLTHSKCRTWDSKQNKDVSACVTCKSPCVDIDAEKTYWEELFKPGRHLVQYGYLGLVLGFFGYFFLYHGGWDYYYEGEFYQPQTMDPLWSQGFFFSAIPRVVAIPITLIISVAVFTTIGTKLEKFYKAYLLRNLNSSEEGTTFLSERSRHQIFAIFTVIAFNLFFAFGWRTLFSMDSMFHHVFTLATALLSAWWLGRNFQRDRATYELEGKTTSLRRQLKKLPIDLSQYLRGRTIDILKPEEVYILAHVIPQISQDKALTLYKGLMVEAIEKNSVKSQATWEWLTQMQHQLELTEAQHEAVLSELSQERPELFQTISNSDHAPTIIGMPETDGYVNTDETMTVIRDIRASSADAPTIIYAPQLDSTPTQIYHPKQDDDKTIIGVNTNDAETQIHESSKDQKMKSDQIHDPDATEIYRPEE